MVKHIQNPASIIRILGTVLIKDWFKYVTKCFLERKKCGFNRLGFLFPKMSDV